MLKIMGHGGAITVTLTHIPWFARHVEHFVAKMQFTRQAATAPATLDTAYTTCATFAIFGEISNPSEILGIIQIIITTVIYCDN
jgi:hypothetical protein